jgi:hypothetical protein
LSTTWSFAQGSSAGDTSCSNFNRRSFSSSLTADYSLFVLLRQQAHRPLSISRVARQFGAGIETLHSSTSSNMPGKRSIPELDDLRREVLCLANNS